MEHRITVGSDGMVLTEVFSEVNKENKTLLGFSCGRDKTCLQITIVESKGTSKLNSLFEDFLLQHLKCCEVQSGFSLDKGSESYMVITVDQQYSSIRFLTSNQEVFWDSVGSGSDILYPCSTCPPGVVIHQSIRYVLLVHYF